MTPSPTPQPAADYRSLFRLVTLLLVLLAGPAWAIDQPRELVIGIEPEHNIFTQMEHYGRLADYLSEKSGIPIRLTIMSRYGKVLERFKAMHLDGAFLNAYTATLASDELGMEPVVRQVNLAGEAGAHGLIFTRRDSGIHGVAEMRGKSFAFVDSASATGYLFPLSLLKKNGAIDINTFFSRHFFTGSHASTISAVLDGRADLGVAKERIYKRQVASDPSIAKELAILAKSPLTPETTFCLRSDLPADLKNKLTDILLEMNKSKEGLEVLAGIESLRFTRAAKTDYNIVRQMGEEAGISRLGR
ncbi:MAG TPA: phosphate/phosphite/phosphonate ABC transporter substrate-binding protein [Desulfurivibrionaceae bacterium]|nr:phosphate/phosphite/phosphonate ABC transporter substrate-binding protein [Desulfurivibrionaceae bacterium]